MAIKKTITVDGIEVPFKASAAVPRLYRIKFRRSWTSPDRSAAPMP